jgi:hypothetical protein
MIFDMPHTKHSPASAAVLPAKVVKDKASLNINILTEIYTTTKSNLFTLCRYKHVPEQDDHNRTITAQET